MPSPRGGHDDAGLVAGAAALLVVTLAVATWIPVALTSPPGYTGGGPVAVAEGLVSGRIRWDAACTLIAVSEVAALAVLAALAAAGRLTWQRRRTRVDPAARRMARRRDVAHLAPAGVTASARRLRPGLGPAGRIDPDQAGVLVCTTVAGGIPLRQSWEDMAIDIWGPRTGKTTARAIPAIVAAPGPTLVTSVKGDVVDATCGVRADLGAVWLFDPQDICGQQQRCWWNPLRGVGTITDARRLAEHFANAERAPGVQRDAFFDPAAESLVANLLLAASVAGREILDVYRWSANPRDDAPAVILREHGHPLPADAVNGVINLPDKTRGGIYAGAQQMLACLTEPAVTAWITPPASRRILEFVPAAFASSTDTLYLLSQGGPGSPAPLIAGLTDAVLRAGETRARRSPGRRLDPPMLAVLDEAANICRLRQLPALYSYYGSHGLPIITILQSYAQGIAVWGRDDMRKLWSAANIRTYGGGVVDPDFLEELSRLIGEHDVITRSTSTSGIGWGTRSVSRSSRRERILDVAALGALPRGRMVLYASGAPPVLGRTVPWQQGPYADRIRASIREWDPDHHRSGWTLQPADDPPLARPGQ